MNNAEAALHRNQNCSYTHDVIPYSDCSNKKNHLGEIRGTCTPEGFCVCNECYTGTSDWINLEGLDCQVQLQYTTVYYPPCNFALVATIVYLWHFSVGLRVFWKTYSRSKLKDKTFKAQLAKPLNQDVAASFTSNFPVLIMATVKFFSPNTLMVDPSANHIFFTITFLFLGAEWLSYSFFFLSLVEPIAKGLHNQSKRNNINFILDISRYLKRIPIADFFIRIFFIILPALVGFWTNNQNLTIVVFTFVHLYSRLKYVIFFALYGRLLHLSSCMVRSGISRATSSTGSTAEKKLLVFKKKIKIAAIILSLCSVYIEFDVAGFLFIYNPKQLFGRFPVQFIWFWILQAFFWTFILDFLTLRLSVLSSGVKRGDITQVIQ